MTRRRLSWLNVRYRRCHIRWLRAGMPVPNRMTDAPEWRPVYIGWPVVYRRK